MIFYIAATNVLSWGKGTEKWEAVAHALHWGGEVATARIFKIKAPKDSLESDIYLSGDGTIHAPGGSEITEVEPVDCRELRDDFKRFCDKVN